MLVSSEMLSSKVLLRVLNRRSQSGDNADQNLGRRRQVGDCSGKKKKGHKNIK
jgi:hypothetical protein